MSPEEIRLLYDYNAWANRRALTAAAALTPEQFTKPMSSSFSSRSPSSLPDTTQYPDVASLGERWREFEPRLLNFARNLTQGDLDRVMEYKTLKFGVYSNPLWQSMQHLVNHGTYHRGQVTALLRQLGAQPILTDLMHFYRERAMPAKA